MKVVLKGNKKSPKILMIFPFHVSEEFLKIFDPYLDAYYLICPILNGHNIEDNSTYLKRKGEADQILNYLEKNNINQIDVLFGSSLGCATAWEILLSRKIKINRTVFDGGCFGKYSIVMQWMNYVGTHFMVNSIRKNPSKVNYYDQISSELEFGNMITATMAHYSDETIRNMISDSMCGTEVISNAIREEDNLVVMYGSKDSYIKGLKWFDKAEYPYTKLIQKGYKHCRYMGSETKKFVDILLGN